MLRQTIQQQRSVLSTLPPVQDEYEPMNTSLVAESSPMVMETTSVAKEQWRVPPIEDNQTVDIFIEPEYAQVIKVSD